MPTIFALPDLEVNVAQRQESARRRKTSQPENGRTRHARVRLGFRYGPAHHQFRKLGAGGARHVAFRHQLAAAQDVTRLQAAMTSPSLCEMKMIDRPLATKRLQRLEQGRGFLRREHRGRFVEDEDAGVAVERLEDLDALALAHRKRSDGRVGIDGQPEVLAPACGCGCAPRRAARTAATGFRCRARCCPARSGCRPG